MYVSCIFIWAVHTKKKITFKFHIYNTTKYLVHRNTELNQLIFK